MTANLESFLDAIIRTFQYYGGVPRRVIFDNARVAVKSGFGAHAAAQDDYKQLSAHYGFEPVFCNPASGNEKGLVENLVGYIRRNVCVPLPKVKNLEELNGKLLEKCVRYLDHKVDSRPAPVGILLEEDRQCLHPKQPHRLNRNTHTARSEILTPFGRNLHVSDFRQSQEWRSERYARRHGVNAGLAAVAY